MDYKTLYKLTDFLIDNIHYNDREKVKKYIADHLKYGTIDYIVDKEGNILAICRWNVKEGGKVGEILDLAVHKGYREHNFGKSFMLRAIQKYPQVEFLEYTRGTLNGDNRIRRLPVKKILEATKY
jgi:N-acetylglutamate synthase-like GNAT family acetyltransferase